MLPAGIAVMAASVVLGVIALTLAASMSSAGRSAGRRTREAMYPGGAPDHSAARPYRPEQEAPHYPAGGPYEPAEQDERDYPADMPYEPAEQDERDYAPDAPYEPAEEAPAYVADRDATAYAAEAEQPPRWVLALAIASGAGLMLGLLMVMIASIP